MIFHTEIDIVIQRYQYIKEEEEKGPSNCDTYKGIALVIYSGSSCPSR